jgi:hypothetical protein
MGSFRGSMEWNPLFTTSLDLFEHYEMGEDDEKKAFERHSANIVFGRGSSAVVLDGSMTFRQEDCGKTVQSEPPERKAGQEIAVRFSCEPRSNSVEHWSYSFTSLNRVVSINGREGRRSDTRSSFSPLRI